MENESKKQVENINNSNKKLLLSDVNKRYFITKTRFGTYEVLTELQYEKKLMYGS